MLRRERLEIRPRGILPMPPLRDAQPFPEGVVIGKRAPALTDQGAT